MDMDPIGKHCALQSCNVLDFLPIKCACLKWFCDLHISPDLHGCSWTFVQHRPPDSLPLTRECSKCAFSGCNKPPLITEVTVVDPAGGGSRSSGGCPGCHLNFCAHHRHMQSHSCAANTTGKDNEKNEAARAILAQNFSVTATSKSRTPVVHRQRNPPSDPQKLAQLQKINLMRLRHKAVPGDPKDKGSVVAIEQRLHVIVGFEATNQPAKEVALWFRRTTTTGRALDLAVQHFGVAHATSMFHFRQSSGEMTGHILQNHLELSSQTEDGSTIVLTDSQSDG